MIRDINRFSKGEYDLLVIGGGINGAAIANMAAADGLKVALIEKGDFASGTSSKSTKLIHGGLRYLEHFEFGLVREALKERFIQLKSLPHLVRPIRFIIPVYKNDPRPFWMIKLGIRLYQFLSGRFSIGDYRFLDADEVVSLEPAIKRPGLIGGVMYFDAQMDDARVCLENVLSADNHGAHVANYVEGLSFVKENGKVAAVKAKDVLTEKTFTIRAIRTVCATGPWANVLFKIDNKKAKKVLRTTKGVHIVYKGKITNHAVVFTVKKDKRIFFVIPFKGDTLIGTTDTNYARSPDHVATNQNDINYLFNEVKKFFPGIEFKEVNIITTFAGVRPLIRKKGAPSKVSRRHAIVESASGIIFVLGGKYTTYRKIAEDCLKKFTKCKVSSEYVLYGSGAIRGNPDAIALQYGLDVEIIKSLMRIYGTRYKDVLTLTKDSRGLKRRICPCSPIIKAQLEYSREVEMAVSADDIIWRRLSLGYQDCSTKQCRKAVKKFFTNA